MRENPPSLIREVFSLVRRAVQSLKGTIVFFQIVYSIPMFAIFSDRLFYDGGPTTGWVLYMLLLFSGGGLIVAILSW